MNLRYGPSISIPVLVMAGFGLVCPGTGAAQDPEADPIRVCVMTKEEVPEAVGDLDLPAGEWQVEPFSWAPEGVTYSFKTKQGQEAVTALSRELQKTKSRQRLMQVVETRDEADLFLDIIATEAKGSIRGGGIASSGSTAPSSVTTSAQQPVMVVRLSIRNQVFTSDFLGTRVDILRPPAHAVAQQIERWVETNFEILQQALAGLP